LRMHGIIAIHRKILLVALESILPIFWNGMGQFWKILHNYFKGWEKIFRELLATNFAGLLH